MHLESEASQIQPDTWESALTSTTAQAISVRGYDLAQLIGLVGFPAVLYLLYVGELPTKGQARLMDALMVAAIDHGPATPSALAARVAISGGATLQAAGAAGLLTMGESHGAAVESSMNVIARVVSLASSETDGIPAAAAEVVEEERAAGRRVPGFGHRQHKEQDPRIDRVFQLAAELNDSSRHVDAARAIEATLRNATGHDVPINIDGAMAAVLSDMGFPAAMSNALFISARMTGVLRHAIEEQTMSPMRSIDPRGHTYSGPPPRSLPKDYRT